MESVRLEESYINQKVNTALCSAVGVLSTDKNLCKDTKRCVSHGQGSFEMLFSQQEKQKIDSVIEKHLWYNHIQTSFVTTFSPYNGDSINRPLAFSQALLYPENRGEQNVLVQIELPSRAELIKSKTGGSFLLSVLVLILITAIFVSTLRGLVREKKIRKESVDFINSMAHDLKTPLSNISFALALLDRDRSVTLRSQNHFISIITEETARLKDKAKRMLNMSSVESVLETPAEKAEIDIHELIIQIIKTFKIRLKESDNNIVKNFKAGDAKIVGVRNQVSSAISNIIDNALIYGDTPVLVEINTWNESGRLVISIKDNGPGISLHEQELVFKKAYRVTNGNMAAEGHGMGLYLSRKLIEKQGGRLTLESDGYSGSSFVIAMPLM